MLGVILAYQYISVKSSALSLCYWLQNSSEHVPRCLRVPGEVDGQVGCDPSDLFAGGGSLPAASGSDDNAVVWGHVEVFIEKFKLAE